MLQNIALHTTAEYISMCGLGGYNKGSGWLSSDYCPSIGFNQSGSTPDTHYLYTLL
jgi:hypothetical protein